MKLLIITLIVAQLHGALCAVGPAADQRGLLDIYDLISPFVMPIAQGIDSAMGTVSNIHSQVSNALSNAVYNFTSWIGDKIPALGKRDVEVDAQLKLLNELRTLRLAFQTTMFEVIQSFFNGNLSIKFGELMKKLSTLLKTHLQYIKEMINTLVPTVEGIAGNQALASVLNVVKVIEEVIEKLHAIFSV